MARMPDIEGKASPASGQFDHLYQSGGRLPSWLPAVIITSFFLILGVYYSINTPLWEAPDEPAHFGNVYYIATYGKLPGPGTFYTWHESPLYHIIAAQVVRWVDMPSLADWTRFNP